jgi:hypothetical protein
MSKFLMLCLLLLTLVGLAFAGPYDRMAPVNESSGDPPFLGPILSTAPCPDSVCTLSCPPRARQEGEYVPNYNDHFNSGCLDLDGTPSFSPIACGDTVCGTSYSRQTSRDTDWYKLIVGPDQVNPIEVCFKSSFVALVAIYRAGTNGCTNMTTFINPTMMWPCANTCFNLPAAPATYYLYISYAYYHCVGTGNYVIGVRCEPGQQQNPEWDMGDLPLCGYPTLILNPAHRISNIAWLGAQVSADTMPRILNEDTFDDGVTFLSPPWTPCEMESVQVVVTAGPLFAQYAAGGDGALFVNGWKDGNLDGDFCDELCDGAASEWIVQDRRVPPGTYIFSFRDPGVFNLGRYDARFRFRLSAEPLGRMGFGGIDLQGCPAMTCGTHPTDILGEVEDYIITDMQLAVELFGNLRAENADGRVSLSWLTASETQNDRFEILRDGALVGSVTGAGTSVSTHNYNFTDDHLVNGRIYHYTLEAVGTNGDRQQVAAATAVPTADPAEITNYALYPSYPNPFNAITRIPFDVPVAGVVTLKIYDVMGREVATLVNGELPRGRHEITFDASRLPTAVYLCRFTADGFTATEKLLLMK